MSLLPLGFRRMVLGLDPLVAPEASELAVEFAYLFGLELLGLYIDDPAMRHVTAMPAARALSIAGGFWSRLEPLQSVAGANYAAEATKRRFTEASHQLSRRGFEVVRAGPAQAFASVSRSDDIIVIVPPGPASHRASEPFVSILAAAFASDAAVMLAPARMRRAGGPVLAIAAASYDPSINAAMAIAATTGERLVIVDIREIAGGAMRLELRSGLGNPATTQLEKKVLLDYAAEAVPHALRGLAARIVVITRGTVRNEAALALSRAAPVLILGPRRADRT